MIKILGFLVRGVLTNGYVCFIELSSHPRGVVILMRGVLNKRVCVFY